MVHSLRTQGAAPRARKLALTLAALAIVTVAVLALALPAGAQVLERRSTPIGDGPPSTSVGDDRR
ncbi:MAG: hypothetical protein NTX19_09005 [Gemmatimonadetes bacterium]|nr:hypothetical protein [Gemmatimonadota bacterium]